MADMLRICMRKSRTPAEAIDRKDLQKPSKCAFAFVTRILGLGSIPTDGPRLGGSNSAGPRDGKDDGLTPVTEDGPYDGPRLGGSSSVGPQDERETGRRNTVSVAGDRSWQGFARIRPPGGDGGNGTGAFGTDVETELQSDIPDRSTLETHAIADPAIPTAKTRPAV
jgi:hypothetical protein